MSTRRAFVAATVAIVAVFVVSFFGEGLRNDSVADQSRRRLCQSAVHQQETIRAVVRAATRGPSARPAVDLPDDPLIDPDIITYLEGLLNRPGGVTGPTGDSTLRERLLAKAPRLRCTDEGAPVPVD